MTGVVVLDASTGTTGRKTVASAGSPEQLTTYDHRLSEGVKIRALAANTGKVYWGFSDAVSASTGYELSAGEADYIPASNGSGIWLDVEVDGEGVCFALI
jgi:outer membrane protein assembly factor BamB